MNQIYDLPRGRLFDFFLIIKYILGVVRLEARAKCREDTKRKKNGLYTEAYACPGFFIGGQPQTEFRVAGDRFVGLNLKPSR